MFAFSDGNSKNWFFQRWVLIDASEWIIQRIISEEFPFQSITSTL